jgi:hypothetical protein
VYAHVADSQFTFVRGLNFKSGFDFGGTGLTISLDFKHKLSHEREPPIFLLCYCNVTTVCNRDGLSRRRAPVTQLRNYTGSMVLKSPTDFTYCARNCKSANYGTVLCLPTV